VPAAAAVRRVFDPTGRPRFAPVLAVARRRVAVALVLRDVDLRLLRLRAVRLGVGALTVSAIQ